MVWQTKEKLLKWTLSWKVVNTTTGLLHLNICQDRVVGYAPLKGPINPRGKYERHLQNTEKRPDHKNTSEGEQSFILIFHFCNVPEAL